jgi:hypothetical protein
VEAEIEGVDNGQQRKDAEEDHRRREEEIGGPLLAHLA